MQKKYFLTALMVLLIFISSCKGGSRGQTSISDIEIKKGFDSLDMEFLKNAPPEIVFENTPFLVIVKLRNKGAYDIEKNKGALAIGMEKDYVKINLDAFKKTDKLIPDKEKDRIIFGLDGKSLSNPTGEQEIVELNLETKDIGAQSESRKSTVFATACYDYGTELGTQVCIDTDISSLIPGKKACSASDLVFANGQGSPVAITKIETKMLPDADNNLIKPHFIIHIENKGNGEVIKSGSFDEVCSSGSLSYREFNLVSVSAFLSGQEIGCASAIDDDEGAFIKLKDKKSMVRCTLDQGIDRNLDPYSTPLEVKLNYGYTFTASKEFTIEKILKY